MDIERLKVDESLWPEGATHYWPPSGDWYLLDGDDVFALDGEQWLVAEAEYRVFDRESIERPKSREWDGNGLPPVGAVCEFKLNEVRYRQYWVSVSPVFFSDQIVVLEHSASGNQFAHRLEDVEFRSIKTEKERERDDAMAVAFKGVDDEEFASIEWEAHATRVLEQGVDAILKEYILIERKK